jgi:capsid protein
MVDPTKEIPAKLKAVEGKLISRQRAQREFGYDPDLVRREITEDEQKDAAEPRVEPVPAGDGGGAGDGAGDGGEADAKAGSTGETT